MVEALGECVAVFKPQSAFFEAYGSAGIGVLERTLADIKAAGALACWTSNAVTRAARWTRTPRRT